MKIIPNEIPRASYPRLCVLNPKGACINAQPKFMDELSSAYELSIEPEEIEYLLDLPHGTLTPSKIIDISSLQIKRNK